jgi:2-dehydropantoate 2-reductase
MAHSACKLRRFRETRQPRYDNGIKKGHGMRILVVGAGSIGGYFGGRLLQARRDVTFLVRARRAAQLADAGLSIQSPLGNFDLPHPPTLQAQALRAHFDLILLSCKAYDLDGASESFAPAVGPGTMILPLLNGMRHIDLLQSKFTAQAVLGGLCAISTVLDADGRILHLNTLQDLSFGERGGPRSARTEAVLAELATASFKTRLSDNILQNMWEKWAFIATLAGITCLMRAPIGDIVTANAQDLAVQLYVECAQIAADAGFPPSQAARQACLSAVTQRGSALTASMLRDVESGGRTEAEQILGDLRRRRSSNATATHSVLDIAYEHLKAYETRRNRQLAS